MAKQPISDPEFWSRRLKKARKGNLPLHRAVAECGSYKWRLIERKHHEILCRHIQFADGILDAGCGWGRLLNLMPRKWAGEYLGIDLCPEFIDIALREQPGRAFLIGSFAELLPMIESQSRTVPFDWAILVSIRPMVIRNLGGDTWDKTEVMLRRVAKKLLYLEYDAKDGGSVE